MRNINFNFLNFCTRYSVEGTQNYGMRSEACFGTIFRCSHAYIHNKYTIIIYTNGKKCEYNNNCILTKKQVLSVIKSAKKIHDFKYSLKDYIDEDDNLEGYKLVIELDAPKLYHKYILSWIRYMYEFPFNVCLYEAFNLRKEPGFKNYSLFNLFNLISFSWGNNQHGTDIHGIGRFDRIKKISTSKEVVKTIENNQSVYAEINDVVKYSKQGSPAHYIDSTCMIGNKKYSTNDLMYWTSKKAFRDRVPIYTLNKKYIKNK